MKTVTAFTKILPAILLLITPSIAGAQDAEPVARAQPVAPESTGKVRSGESEPTQAAPVAAATPDVRPLSVEVELVSGNSTIKGTLTDADTIDMRTSLWYGGRAAFGSRGIPISLSRRCVNNRRDAQRRFDYWCNRC